MSWWPLRDLHQVPPLYLANSSFLISRLAALKDSWKQGLGEILLLPLSLTLVSRNTKPCIHLSQRTGPASTTVMDLQYAKGLDRQTSHGLLLGTAFWIQATKLFRTSQQGPSMKLTNLFGSLENRQTTVKQCQFFKRVLSVLLAQGVNNILKGGLVGFRSAEPSFVVLLEAPSCQQYHTRATPQRSRIL